MNACSSAERRGGVADSSLSQSGPPVNSSPSHHGLRHRRQHAPVSAQERPADEADAERIDVQQHEHGEQRDEQQRRYGRCGRERVDEHGARVRESRGEQTDALIREHQRAQQENEEPDDAGHELTLARCD